MEIRCFEVGKSFGTVDRSLIFCIKNEIENELMNSYKSFIVRIFTAGVTHLESFFILSV